MQYFRNPWVGQDSLFNIFVTIIIIIIFIIIVIIIIITIIIIIIIMTIIIMNRGSSWEIREVFQSKLPYYAEIGACPMRNSGMTFTFM